MMFDLLISSSKLALFVAIPVVLGYVTYKLYKKNKPSKFQASWEDRE